MLGGEEDPYQKKEEEIEEPLAHQEGPTPALKLVTERDLHLQSAT